MVLPRGGNSIGGGVREETGIKGELRGEKFGRWWNSAWRLREGATGGDGDHIENKKEEWGIFSKSWDKDQGGPQTIRNKGE